MEFSLIAPEEKTIKLDDDSSIVLNIINPHMQAELLKVVQSARSDDPAEMTRTTEFLMTNIIKTVIHKKVEYNPVAVFSGLNLFNLNSGDMVFAARCLEEVVKHYFIGDEEKKG